MLGEELVLFEADLRITGIDHNVAAEIDNLLQIARRKLEEQAYTRRHALKVPNMRHGRGQIDVAHALAAHFSAGNFYTALIANQTLVTYAFILTAMALPVFNRTKNALAEKSIALRFESSIVNSFGLLDFAERPFTNLFGRGKTYLHSLKIIDIHINLSPPGGRQKIGFNLSLLPAAVRAFNLRSLRFKPEHYRTYQRFRAIHCCALALVLPPSESRSHVRWSPES